MPETAQTQDYHKLVTSVLQKEITILGKQIVLLQARKVSGLTITDDGQVTSMTGDPKEVINQLLQKFRELSSPLVKKTMQPLLHVVIPEEKEAFTPSHSDVQLNPLPDLKAHEEKSNVKHEAAAETKQGKEEL